MQDVAARDKRLWRVRCDVWTLATLGLVALTAWSLVADLGDRPFVADEAETALNADAILQHGVPWVARDGSWLTPFHMGWVNDDQIWTFTPWLDEYVAAAAQAIGGPRAAVLRLPFALAALVSIPLLWAAARRLGLGAQAAFLAVMVYCLCEPFVLFGRKCRYFGLLFLFQAWMAWGFATLLRGRYRAGALHIALALAGGFYCNYVTFVANVAALSLAAVVFVWRGHRRSAWFVGAGVVGALVAAAPWIAYAGASMFGNYDRFVSSLYMTFVVDFGLELPDDASTSSWSLAWGYFGNVLYELRHTATDFGRDVVPWWWAGLLVARLGQLSFFGWPQSGTPRENRTMGELFLWAQVGCTLVIATAIPLHGFRYFLTAIGPAAILVGLTLEDWVRWPALRVALAALVCLIPAFRDPSSVFVPRSWPIVALVHECRTPYTDRVEDVAEYLNRHARPGDTLYTPFDEAALRFHTQLKTRTGIMAPWGTGDLPNWITTEQLTASVSEDIYLPLAPELRSAYEELLVPIHESPRDAMTIETLHEGRDTWPHVRNLRIYRRWPEVASAPARRPSIYVWWRLILPLGKSGGFAPIDEGQDAVRLTVPADQSGDVDMLIWRCFVVTIGDDYDVSSPDVPRGDIELSFEARGEGSLLLLSGEELSSAHALPIGLGPEWKAYQARVTIVGEPDRRFLGFGVPRPGAVDLRDVRLQPIP